ncbi:MAG: hypothetical protein WDN04_15855 [Rhodospirillales bacterium]
MIIDTLTAWRAAAAACLVAAVTPAVAATYTLSRISIPGATQVGVIGITQSGLYYGFYKTAANDDLHTFTQAGSKLATYDLGTPGVASFRANNTGDIVGDEVFGPVLYRFLHSRRSLHASRLFGSVIIALNSRGDTLGRNTRAKNGHFFGVQHLAGGKRGDRDQPGWRHRHDRERDERRRYGLSGAISCGMAAALSD